MSARGIDSPEECKAEQKKPKRVSEPGGAQSSDVRHLTFVDGSGKPSAPAWDFLPRLYKAAQS